VLVGQHAQATEYRFDAQALDALQTSLASYLGHLRRASCRRLVAAICAANPWLAAFIVLDRQTLKLRRRDKAPLAARTVQAQYRHWQQEFAGDMVLMQVGAFVEQLQWPPKRIAKLRAATEAKLTGGAAPHAAYPAWRGAGLPAGTAEKACGGPRRGGPGFDLRCAARRKWRCPAAPGAGGGLGGEQCEGGCGRTTGLIGSG